MSALAKKYLKEKNDDDEKIDENQESKVSADRKKKKNKPDNIFKYTVAIRKIPQDQRKKKNIKDFFTPLKPVSIRIPKIKCLAYVSFKTELELKQALEKHKSFMGKSQVHLQLLKAKDEKETKIEFNKHKGRIEKQVPIENIEENGRLFVRNLNYQCTVEDLEELFKQYGPTTEINLPIDQLTQKIKGYAFITFMFPEHAKSAFQELDRSTFQGRLLHLIPAEVKDSDSKQFSDDSSFKKRKNAQLKNESTKSSNWNTLFLGQNAIANILAKKMNIDKSEFFKSAKNESLAARMALGETQLVNETRMFLEQNGVFLNCFNFDNLKRSKTIFLIKHLPSSTTEDELNEFLSAYGRVKKIILPPSCKFYFFVNFHFQKKIEFQIFELLFSIGITAIIEMENQQVAFDIFKKLAYKKFKNIPLYLEWAPVNVLDRNAVDVMESVSERSKVKKFKRLEYGVDELKEEQNDDKQENNNKIKENNDDAINAMNEEAINEIEQEEAEDNKQKSYKILVKNVPFEATIKDIKQLFSAFGDLQFARLPKKLHGTGSHRGFAFIEYMSKNDAKKAFNSLSSSTHLYGRRLVLEWAKTESNKDDF